MTYVCSLLSCFFFQAEDGIRDVAVTGVQTCALPICWLLLRRTSCRGRRRSGRLVDRNEPGDASLKDGGGQGLSMGEAGERLDSQKLSTGRRHGGLEVFCECAGRGWFSRPHFAAPRVRRAGGNCSGKRGEHCRCSPARSPIPEGTLA